jgi:PAS domain S-box-containing protein
MNKFNIRTAILLCVVAAAFFLFLYLYTEQSHASFARSWTQDKIVDFADSLSGSLNTRLRFINRDLLLTHEKAPPRSQEEHLDRTGHLLKENSFIQAINYIDATNHILFFAPTGAPNASGKSQEINLPVLREALEKAATDDGGMVLSRPFTITQDGIGYALVINDTLGGFYQVIFRAEKAFADPLIQHHLEYQISDGDEIVLQTSSFLRQLGNYQEFLVEKSLDVLGRTLVVKALPTDTFPTLLQAHWPLVARIGFILTFSFLVMILFLQGRANRNRQRTNEELDRLVRQRTGEYEEANHLLVQLIAAHKKSQEKLRENDRRLQLVLEGSETGIWDWNIQNDHTSFNDRWAALLGYTLNEITRQTSFWDLLHPDDILTVRKAMQEHLEGDSTLYKAEFRMRTKNGDWKWILSKGKVTKRDEDGTPLRMSGTHQDISGRKLIEDRMFQQYRLQTAFNELLALSLRDQDLPEIFKQFVDTITAVPWLELRQAGAVFLYDRESAYLILSAHRWLSPHLVASCSRLPLGKCLCGQAAATGKTVFASDIDENHHIIYPDMEPHGHYCIPFFSLKNELLGVYTVYQKAGGRRNEEIENSLEAAGRILAGILERKKVEQALKKSEEHYREVIESTGDLITWVTPDGIFTFVNHTAKEIYGLSPEECIGRCAFDFIHPDDRAQTSEWFNSCVRKKLRQSVIENRLMNKATGESRHMLWTSNFHYDQGGELTGIIGVARDISKRIQHEEFLKKTRDDLQLEVEKRTLELQQTHQQLLHAEKLSAIGRLSASIAHEFNNPLFGVSNVLDNLKRNGSLQKKQADLVDMAFRECVRMKHLIRDLQDFNRPTSGVSAPIDLHQTIDSILLLSKKELKNRKIRIKKEFVPHIPLVKAIADQIKQVLLNLLNNAVDAYEDREGTITIGTELLNQEVAVHIRDEGLGIKEEHMPHIFEPFFTTKPAIKGTGLGLSVSYGILKKHGGRIEVNSAPGRGSTFTIILPLNGRTHD